MKDVWELAKANEAYIIDRRKIAKRKRSYIR